jgi:hypothetical protein
MSAEFARQLAEYDPQQFISKGCVAYCRDAPALPFLGVILLDRHQAKQFQQRLGAGPFSSILWEARWLQRGGFGFGIRDSLEKRVLVGALTFYSLWRRR